MSLKKSKIRRENGNFLFYEYFLIYFSRYKKGLKVNIPNFDESTMYTIEVFKFMNKYIDKIMNRSHNFEIIKEGVKLLQLALNNQNNNELDVIPEDLKDNFTPDQSMPE